MNMLMNTATKSTSTKKTVGSSFYSLHALLMYAIGLGTTGVEYEFIEEGEDGQFQPVEEVPVPPPQVSAELFLVLDFQKSCPVSLVSHV